jgi:4-carboxymuconolactone decarboxylase
MNRMTFGLILVGAFFAQACSSGEKQRMDNTIAGSITSGVFPRGDKAPQDTFTGTVYVQPLAPRNENNNFSVASVTFEPGARAFWHTHPAGQTILVTDGLGLYQEKGQPIRTIKKGDVVLCDPDIEHWHGASPESAMTHIVITNYKGESQVNWLRAVTDEEYRERSG